MDDDTVLKEGGRCCSVPKVGGGSGSGCRASSLQSIIDFLLKDVRDLHEHIRARVFRWTRACLPVVFQIKPEVSNQRDVNILHGKTPYSSGQ